MIITNDLDSHFGVGLGRNISSAHDVWKDALTRHAKHRIARVQRLSYVNSWNKQVPIF